MFWETVLGTLTAALICFVANELRKRRRVPVDAWKRRRAEKEAAEVAGTAARRAAALAAARRAVEDRAKSGVGRVPLRVSGVEPKIIDYSDGQRTFRYHNGQSERRAQSLGLATPWNSYHGKVPKPVTEWTIDECNTWLANNPAKPPSV